MTLFLKSLIVNRERGPDVPHKIMFLILEEDLTKIVSFRGCYMNIDHISRVKDGPLTADNTCTAIVYFSDGGSEQFEGVDGESFMGCLSAFGGGKEIPPFGGERTSIPDSYFTPAYEF